MRPTAGLSNESDYASSKSEYENFNGINDWNESSWTKGDTRDYTRNFQMKTSPNILRKPSNHPIHKKQSFRQANNLQYDLASEFKKLVNAGQQLGLHSRASSHHTSISEGIYENCIVQRRLPTSPRAIAKEEDSIRICLWRRRGSNLPTNVEDDISRCVAEIQLSQTTSEITYKLVDMCAAYGSTIQNDIMRAKVNLIIVTPMEARELEQGRGPCARMSCLNIAMETTKWIAILAGISTEEIFTKYPHVFPKFDYWSCVPLESTPKQTKSNFCETLTDQLKRSCLPSQVDLSSHQMKFFSISQLTLYKTSQIVVFSMPFKVDVGDKLNACVRVGNTLHATTARFQNEFTVVVDMTVITGERFSKQNDVARVTLYWNDVKIGTEHFAIITSEEPVSTNEQPLKMFPFFQWSQWDNYINEILLRKKLKQTELKMEPSLKVMAVELISRGKEFPSALHYAAHYGLRRTADTMLKMWKCHESLLTRNSYHKTPVDIANDMGHVDLALCLKKHADAYQRQPIWEPQTIHYAEIDRSPTIRYTQVPDAAAPQRASGYSYAQNPVYESVLHHKGNNPYNMKAHQIEAGNLQRLHSQHYKTPQLKVRPLSRVVDTANVEPEMSNERRCKGATGAIIPSTRALSISQPSLQKHEPARTKNEKKLRFPAWFPWRNYKQSELMNSRGDNDMGKHKSKGGPTPGELETTHSLMATPLPQKRHPSKEQHGKMQMRQSQPCKVSTGISASGVKTPGGTPPVPIIQCEEYSKVFGNPMSTFDHYNTLPRT